MKLLYYLLYRIVSLFILIIELIENIFSVYLLKPHGVVETIELEGIEVLTDTGYQPVKAIHKKRLFRDWELKTAGKSLIAADNHIVFSERKNGETFLKELSLHDNILTKNGIETVTSVRPVYSWSMMYDITVDDVNHRYYTNDILSHNSVTVGIYIVWYILTHTERNIVLLSQNQDKVVDLMDKIDTILRKLPFYLKPGILVDNTMTKQFENGVKLSAKTTTENSAAGITGHLIYIDEFALINPNFIKSFYRTVYPTLSSSDISQLVITSTARGLNKFYDIYNDAIEGKNSFDPLRTDWYEVPMKVDEQGNVIKYRDEAWKLLQIADLGSEEDFNQEYGNQFLAGNQLLFGSTELQKLKHNTLEFVEHEFAVLDEYEVKYRDCLKFNPYFDIENAKLGWFIFSIDLAEGKGRDHSVINIFQVLPMTRKEIENLKIYSDEKDFFKLVQVGIWRSNIYPPEEVAKTAYHLVTDIFDHEKCKMVLEYNYDGKSFVNVMSTIYGEENNVIDIDSLFVQFPVSVVEKTYRIGLFLDQEKRDFGCKMVVGKVKYNQLIIVEKKTTEEAISFYRNKKGKFIGQGNDDAFMTCINVCHIFNTEDFLDIVEEMMEEMSEKFVSLLEYKMSRSVVTNNFKDEDDYASMI